MKVGDLVRYNTMWHRDMPGVIVDICPDPSLPARVIQNDTPGAVVMWGRSPKPVWMPITGFLEVISESR